MKPTTDENTPLYEEIGRRMRERRIELGLTQATVAKRVGVNRISIVQAESGKRRLHLHTIYRIAWVLFVDPRQLFPKELPDARTVVHAD